MNQHETIVSDIHQIVESLGDAVAITPASVAAALIDRYGRPFSPYTEFAAREQFKQMARQVLGRKFDAAAEEFGGETGELFSEKLQGRYPIPGAKGDERTYKLIELLTRQEWEWNIRRMERAGKALLEHSRALHAWGLGRFDKAA